MELLITLFFAALFILLAVTLLANQQAARRQRQRAAAVRLKEPVGITTLDAPAARREPAWAAAAAAFPLLRWVADAEAQAGLNLAPGTLLALLGAYLVVVPALVFRWLPPAPALLVVAGGMLLPFWWMRNQRRQRLKAFARQLPYLLETLKASLEAGHTLVRGLQMAAQNTPAPLAVELRVIVDQVRVGVSLPLALELMSRRVPIDDLGFLADAVAVQEETGSSLALILRHAAESIRNRQRLDDQIRVLTSQSRMSAMIVSLLPVVVLGAFSLVRGDYVDILFHDPVGNRILEIAIGLDLLAFFVMREIARVDY